MFSTYRADSVVSRLGRGELTLDDCPPEVARGARRSASGPGGESGGAFDVRRPGPDGRPCSTRAAWSRAGPSSAPRARCDALPDTDFCLSAGGDMVCRTARPGSPAWRIGIEDPRDPDAGRRRRARSATAPSPPPASPTAAPHIVDARTGCAPPASPRSPSSARDLTWADIDATAAFALGADALAWLRRPGRAGLVVEADGTSLPFGS